MQMLWHDHTRTDEAIKADWYQTGIKGMNHHGQILWTKQIQASLDLHPGGCPQKLRGCENNAKKSIIIASM